MDNPLSILIFGAHGKLGSNIARHAKKHPNYQVAGEVTRQTTTIEPLLEKADVIIDASSPEALLPHLPAIAKAKKPLVVATTGHSPDQIKKITAWAKKIPILLAPNLSEGIAWLKSVAPTLPNGKYEIFECHHSEKKDSPSGTAKELAAALPAPSQIHSERNGDTVGEHRIRVKRPHEIVEITHIATSRDLFAEGALKACSFLYKKTPGVYNDFHDSDTKK